MTDNSDSWPKHPDGTYKASNEMTPEENAQIRADAARRLEAKVIEEKRYQDLTVGMTRPTAVKPLEMLNHAITSGQGIDVIEKLMVLYERHEANQGRKAFDQAIANAKAEIQPIIKNRTVDFTSQKGRTNYDYEDLAEIARTVDPVLSKHGLSYRFRSQQNGAEITITCIVSHRDGYAEENSLSAGNDNSGNKNQSKASHPQQRTYKGIL